MPLPQHCLLNLRMPKRRNVEVLPPPKRLRMTPSGHLDHISTLSDELLLHILSFLPLPALLVCQQYVLLSSECRLQSSLLLPT